MKSKITDNNEFLYSVIHEIKNSLNPVINLSSVMRRNSDGKLDEEESSYLEVIERNGKKILKMVEELSYSRRLSADNGAGDLSEFDMRNAAEDVIKTLSGYTGAKINISDDSVPGIIKTDRTVFRKIVENVFQFFLSSANESRPLFLKVIREYTLCRVVITHGITEFSDRDVHEFKTDKFAEDGFSAGSSIWLQFASYYIERLGGMIHYSHDSSGDIQVQITLPSASSSSVKEETVTEYIADVKPKMDRKFTMLVIDDDIDNITPVNAIIENEFHGAGKVVHAENGGRGLDLLEKVRPDIILLDLTLPDISGYSLVRNIKNLFMKNNIPVIAFTALDDASDREKMKKSGFDDVIKKPFNIDTFVSVISRWIE